MSAQGDITVWRNTAEVWISDFCQELIKGKRNEDIGFPYFLLSKPKHLPLRVIFIYISIVIN